MAGLTGAQFVEQYYFWKGDESRRKKARKARDAARQQTLSDTEDLLAGIEALLEDS